MSDYVSYKELAKRLGVDPTTIRRVTERYGAELGISVQKGAPTPATQSGHTTSRTRMPINLLRSTRHALRAHAEAGFRAFIVGTLSVAQKARLGREQ